MMDTDSVIDALNEVLLCEQRALAPRLFESTVFISRLSVDSWRVAEAMVHSNHANRAALTVLIGDLGGVPGLRPCDVTTGDLHFQEVRCVLPRLISSQEQLIASCRSVVERLGSEPGAVELVTSILARHEGDLASLRELHDAAPQELAS